MKFFSKLKDYHNLLEEILEQKTFSSIAKSLLLSMIYKLEISYKDYSGVKVDCISKDVFLDAMLEAIKNYCDHIKIVEPESTQATLLVKNKVQTLTNTKERSILAYPTEIAMLEAIADIQPKYFFVKKDFPFKEILQNLLVKGYKQNTVEILKNFNGWSWDINENEKMDYVANLIYQNIMMIKGELFLYKWRTDAKGRKNYLAELKDYIQRITGNEEYYFAFCNVLDCVSKNVEETEMRKALIDLQKNFLKIIEKKIKDISLREEILKIFYQLRLFQNLNFGEGELIKNCPELSKPFQHALKLVVTKACKLGILKIISMDIETNFQVFQYILDTRIIDLEQIKIYLEMERDYLFIKVYDKEVFEKQTKIKWKGNKKDIIIRKKKKINIFH